MTRVERPPAGAAAAARRRRGWCLAVAILSCLAAAASVSAESVRIPCATQLSRCGTCGGAPSACLPAACSGCGAAACVVDPCTGSCAPQTSAYNCTRTPLLRAATCLASRPEAVGGNLETYFVSPAAQAGLAFDFYAYSPPDAIAAGELTVVDVKPVVSIDERGVATGAASVLASTPPGPTVYLLGDWFSAVGSSDVRALSAGGSMHHFVVAVTPTNDTRSIRLDVFVDGARGAPGYVEQDPAVAASMLDSMRAGRLALRVALRGRTGLVLSDVVAWTRPPATDDEGAALSAFGAAAPRSLIAARWPLQEGKGFALRSVADAGFSFVRDDLGHGKPPAWTSCPGAAPSRGGAVYPSCLGGWSEAPGAGIDPCGVCGGAGETCMPPASEGSVVAAPKLGPEGAAWFDGSTSTYWTPARAGRDCVSYVLPRDAYVTGFRAFFAGRIRSWAAYGYDAFGARRKLLESGSAPATGVFSVQTLPTPVRLRRVDLCPTRWTDRPRVAEMALFVGRDACGVPGGDDSTCTGCDGVPNSGKTYDVCGICGGSGKACMGCDGVPFSRKIYDWRGTCGGNRTGLAAQDPNQCGNVGTNGTECWYALNSPQADRLPYLPAYSSEHTVEFWFSWNVTAPAAGSELLSGPNTAYTVRTRTAITLAVEFTAAARIVCGFPGGVTPTGWTHMAIARDASGIVRAWLGGARCSSGQGYPAADGGLLQGPRLSGSGFVAEYRVWNTAWNDTRVASAAYLATGREAGLVSYVRPWVQGSLVYDLALARNGSVPEARSTTRMARSPLPYARVEYGYTCDLKGGVYDVCGVCGGDGSSCAGCDGQPYSGRVRDRCGVCGGDDSSCRGCDGVPNSGKVLDQCGVCGGDGSTCAGCDGVGGAVNAFGICRPPGSNEASCGGEASDKRFDAYGVCGGDARASDPDFDATRTPCGAPFDECGVCGGDGSSCRAPWCDLQAYSRRVNNRYGICGGEAEYRLGCSSALGPGSRYDACGVCGGSALPGDCAPCDGVGLYYDQCGVCGGDNSTCTDCRGRRYGLSDRDACGVCEGLNNTCVGCDGVPGSGKVRDGCGRCGGDGSTCRGCDGVPGSGLRTDLYGTCNGTQRTPLPVSDRCGVPGGDGTGCTPAIAINVGGAPATLQLPWELVARPSWTVSFWMRPTTTSTERFGIFGLHAADNYRSASGYCGFTGGLYLRSGVVPAPAQCTWLESSVQVQTSTGDELWLCGDSCTPEIASGSASGVGFDLLCANTQGLLNLRDARSAQGIFTVEPYDLRDQWTHVTIAYDGAARAATVYYNGTRVMGASRRAVDSGAQLISGDPRSAIPFIGGSGRRMGFGTDCSGPSGAWFSGYVAEVRGYARALSAAEVAAGFRAPPNLSDPSLLVSYSSTEYETYLLDDAAGGFHVLARTPGKLTTCSAVAASNVSSYVAGLFSSDASPRYSMRATPSRPTSAGAIRLPAPAVAGDGFTAIVRFSMGRTAADATAGKTWDPLAFLGGATGSCPGGQIGVQTRTSLGVPVFRAVGSTGAASEAPLATTTPLAGSGVWHDLVVSYSASADLVRVWFDGGRVRVGGTSDFTFICTTPLLASGLRLSVGYGWTANDWVDVSDVRVWNFAAPDDAAASAIRSNPCAYGTNRTVWVPLQSPSIAALGASTGIPALATSTSTSVPFTGDVTLVWTGASPPYDLVTDAARRACPVFDYACSSADYPSRVARLPGAPLVPRTAEASRPRFFRCDRRPEIEPTAECLAFTSRTSIGTQLATGARPIWYRRRFMRQFLRSPATFTCWDNWRSCGQAGSGYGGPTIRIGVPRLFTSDLGFTIAFRASEDSDLGTGCAAAPMELSGTNLARVAGDGFQVTLARYNYPYSYPGGVCTTWRARRVWVSLSESPASTTAYQGSGYNSGLNGWNLWVVSVDYSARTLAVYGRGSSGNTDIVQTIPNIRARVNATSGLALFFDPTATNTNFYDVRAWNAPLSAAEVAQALTDPYVRSDDLVYHYPFLYEYERNGTERQAFSSAILGAADIPWSAIISTSEAPAFGADGSDGAYGIPAAWPQPWASNATSPACAGLRCAARTAFAAPALPDRCVNKPLYYDSCGRCGGDNSTCYRDCTGEIVGKSLPNGCGSCSGDATCLDCGGKPYGTNYTCVGCDGRPKSRKVVDGFGVCGGEERAPTGCDGVPFSRKVYDACGVCGGNNRTCAGCDGVPWSGVGYDRAGTCGGNATAGAYDVCGVLNGDGSTCRDECTGLPWGGLRRRKDGTCPRTRSCDGGAAGNFTLDACGVCGGTGASCSVVWCDGNPFSGKVIDWDGRCSAPRFGGNPTTMVYDACTDTYRRIPDAFACFKRSKLAVLFTNGTAVSLPARAAIGPFGATSAEGLVAEAMVAYAGGASAGGTVLAVRTSAYWVNVTAAVANGALRLTVSTPYASSTLPTAIAYDAPTPVQIVWRRTGFQVRFALSVAYSVPVATAPLPASLEELWVGGAKVATWNVWVRRVADATIEPTSVRVPPSAEPQASEVAYYSLAEGWGSILHDRRGAVVGYEGASWYEPAWAAPPQIAPLATYSCSGEFGAASTYDRCGVCAGDNSTCAREDLSGRIGWVEEANYAWNANPARRPNGIYVERSAAQAASDAECAARLLSPESERRVPTYLGAAWNRVTGLCELYRIPSGDASTYEFDPRDLVPAPHVRFAARIASAVPDPWRRPFPTPGPLTFLVTPTPSPSPTPSPTPTPPPFACDGIWFDGVCIFNPSPALVEALRPTPSPTPTPTPPPPPVVIANMSCGTFGQAGCRLRTFLRPPDLVAAEDGIASFYACRTATQSAAPARFFAIRGRSCWVLTPEEFVGSYASADRAGRCDPCGVASCGRLSDPYFDPATGERGDYVTLYDLLAPVDGCGRCSVQGDGAGVDEGEVCSSLFTNAAAVVRRVGDACFAMAAATTCSDDPSTDCRSRAGYDNVFDCSWAAGCVTRYVGFGDYYFYEGQGGVPPGACNGTTYVEYATGQFSATRCALPAGRGVMNCTDELNDRNRVMTCDPDAGCVALDPAPGGRPLDFAFRGTGIPVHVPPRAEWTEGAYASCYAARLDGSIVDFGERGCALRCLVDEFDDNRAIAPSLPWVMVEECPRDGARYGCGRRRLSPEPGSPAWRVGCVRLDPGPVAYSQYVPPARPTPEPTPTPIPEVLDRTPYGIFRRTYRLIDGIIISARTAVRCAVPDYAGAYRNCPDDEYLYECLDRPPFCRRGPARIVRTGSNSTDMYGGVASGAGAQRGATVPLSPPKNSFRPVVVVDLAGGRRNDTTATVCAREVAIASFPFYAYQQQACNTTDNTLYRCNLQLGCVGAGPIVGAPPPSPTPTPTPVAIGNTGTNFAPLWIVDAEGKRVLAQTALACTYRRPSGTSYVSVIAKCEAYSGYQMGCDPDVGCVRLRAVAPTLGKQCSTSEGLLSTYDACGVCGGGGKDRCGKCGAPEEDCRIPEGSVALRIATAGTDAESLVQLLAFLSNSSASRFYISESATAASAPSGARIVLRRGPRALVPLGRRAFPESIPAADRRFLAEPEPGQPVVGYTVWILGDGASSSSAGSSRAPASAAPGTSAAGPAGGANATTAAEAIFRDLLAKTQGSAAAAGGLLAVSKAPVSISAANPNLDEAPAPPTGGGGGGGSTGGGDGEAGQGSSFGTEDIIVMAAGAGAGLVAFAVLACVAVSRYRNARARRAPPA